MAENTDNAATIQTAAPAADAGSTASAANQTEHDGTFEADVARPVVLDSAKAEAARRAAYEKATGKAEPASPANPQPQSDADDSAGSSTSDPEEDDEGFDPDNGLDAAGKPIKGDQTARSQRASDKDAPNSETTTSKEQTPPTAGEREALVVAKRALRLAGFNDADLDGLPPARVLVLGKQASDRNAKVNAALRQAAEIRKKAAAGGDPADGDFSDTATENRGRRAPKPDRIDALIDELEGKTPEPDPEADPELDAIADPKTKAIQAELAEARQELLARNIQDGISGLLADFPQLRGKEAKAALYEAMDRLDPTGAAQGNRDELHRLMRDAAYITIGPVITERAKQERRAKAQAERDGQPDTGGDTARAPRRQVSAEDKRRAAFETAKTPSREEAVRNYRAAVAKRTGAAV